MIRDKGEIQKCTSCGLHNANHTICKWWETPQYQYLCCKCYVEQGNSPADWHPVCMSTYKELTSKVKVNDL